MGRDPDQRPVSCFPSGPHSSLAFGNVYTQPDLDSVASTTSSAWAPASHFAEKVPGSLSALNGMTKDLIGRVRRKNNPFQHIFEASSFGGTS